MNHKEIERWYRLRNIKRAAQILMVMAVMLLLLGYAGSRLLREPVDRFRPPVANGDAGRIENFSFSFPGVYPVELQAPAAVLHESERRVELENPIVTVPDEHGNKVIITARSGELDERARKVSAQGDVTIQYGDFAFEAGNIHYSDEGRVAETSSRVSMSGNGMFVTGKGMRLWVDKKEVVIKTDVEARFFGARLTELSRRMPRKSTVHQ